MLVAIEIVTSNSNIEGGENRCVSYQRDSLKEIIKEELVKPFRCLTI